MFDDDDPFDEDALDYRVFSPEDEVDDVDDPDPPENRPSLDVVIAHFASGEFSYSDLAGLSDLGSADLAVLASRWREFAAPLRATVVREAADIGADNLFLEFSRFFIMASHDEEPAIRQLATQALGIPVGQGVEDRLMRLLECDMVEDVRIAAAASLGAWMELAELDDERLAIGSTISDLLFRVAEMETESWHVRRRAAESVAIVGPNPRVNRLIQRMYDEDETGLRASALYAAGRAHQREWLPVVMEEIVSDDPEIRYEAVRAAGALRDTVALPILSELALDDEDSDIRQSAIAAIGEIGGPGAVRILKRLAENARESDQEAIEDALTDATLEDDAF